MQYTPQQNTWNAGFQAVFIATDQPATLPPSTDRPVRAAAQEAAENIHRQNPDSCSDPGSNYSGNGDSGIEEEQAAGAIFQQEWSLPRQPGMQQGSRKKPRTDADQLAGQVS